MPNGFECWTVLKRMLNGFLNGNFKRKLYGKNKTSCQNQTINWWMYSTVMIYATSLDKADVKRKWYRYLRPEWTQPMTKWGVVAFRKPIFGYPSKICIEISFKIYSPSTKALRLYVISSLSQIVLIIGWIFMDIVRIDLAEKFAFKKIHEQPSTWLLIIKIFFSLIFKSSVYNHLPNFHLKDLMAAVFWIFFSENLN
jgi:hypothetical protein